MNQSPGVGGYISVNRVVKAGLIKKGTVEQRLRGEGAWPHSGSVPVETGRWAERARGAGRRSQRGSRGWSVPHRWH